MRILIVDDEPGIRQMLALTLASEGYDTTEAADASEAQRTISHVSPDLILLDWMLAGISGVDLARRLKRDPKTNEIAIIMLTAKGEEADKVAGLDSGADDFITKPFSTHELLARVRAVLRRRRREGPRDIVTMGDIRLDSQTHRITVKNQELAFSPTEFRLLQFFLTHPERVYNRAQLLDAVWGDGNYIEERTVDVHIRRLRKSLAPFDCDRLIQTVRGVGYRFSTQREEKTAM